MRRKVRISVRIKNKMDKKTKMGKKSKFQKEIEKDEKRLEDIYNKILGIYFPEKNFEIPEKNCILN